jgi:hemerythrin
METGRNGSMAYYWNKNLETGCKVMDDQHRELIAAVYTLNELNRAGRPHNEILEILLFLISSINNHLREEEALQIRFQYPEYGRHKNGHYAFRLRANEFVQKLMSESFTMECVNEATTYIGDWLINHIKEDDFPVAAFIQNRTFIKESAMQTTQK